MHPDYAVHRNGLLAGHVELEAPGTGADSARFRGRNRAQFKRFSAAPNMLYGDGDEWALYRGGRVDLAGFAALLAPLCRMLRDDVADALGGGLSPLVTLAGDWRQLLFPDASDAQFADAYAQTVAFALLLGRSEGADPLTLDSAQP